MKKDRKPEVGEQGALTPRYAINVLPGRNHPHYTEDEVVEHLAHFREWVLDNLAAIRNRKPKSLESRFIPLGFDDLKEMAKLSFRKGKVLVKADWEYIEFEEKLPWDWDSVFPAYSDDEYRKWTVYEMAPQIPLENGYKFVCIEIDPNFEQSSRNQEIEFEVGFLSQRELTAFIENINRNETPS